MRVIWSGVALSATRTDPQSGLPLEYRLIVYDTGEASCTCPAFAFGGSRNPKVAPKDRYRVRCKHLDAAFASGQVADPSAVVEPETPVGELVTGDSPANTPLPKPEREQVDLFVDDDTPHLVR